MSILGFIGTGNMGGALARAAAKKAENKLLLANRSPEKAAALAAEIGGERTDNAAVVQRADYIFLGVKPHLLPGMLESVQGELSRRESHFGIRRRPCSKRPEPDCVPERP